MNWDAIGAVAEAVGAAGVILSLIYLALQIQRATVTANASAHHQYLLTQSSVNPDHLTAFWPRKGVR